MFMKYKCKSVELQLTSLLSVLLSQCLCWPLLVTFHSRFDPTPLKEQCLKML